MAPGFFRRVRNTLIGVGAACTVTISGMPAAEAAEPGALLNFSLPNGSSELFHIPSPEELRAQSEEQAWQLRNNIHRDADRLLPPAQARDIKNMVDGAIEVVFPGIIARYSDNAVGPVAPADQPTDGNPCPEAAKACVDVAHQVAWLQDGKGHKVGPVVNVSTGATHWDTPAGSHRVSHKVRNEVSRAFGNAPMPNSVYFAGDGVAFHAGDPNVLSHGCVHLSYNDSERFYNHLNNGDTVYVWGTIGYGVPNGRVLR